jgi:hypothetical protein
MRSKPSGDSFNFGAGGIALARFHSSASGNIALAF